MCGKAEEKKTRETGCSGEDKGPPQKKKSRGKKHEEKYDVREPRKRRKGKTSRLWLKCEEKVRGSGKRGAILTFETRFGKG